MLIDWRRSEKLVQEIAERPQPTVEVYDQRYLEYLEGERKDVPKDEEKRGVIIIPF